LGETNMSPTNTLAAVCATALLAVPAAAAPVYNNLTPTSAIGVASRPGGGNPFEIEAGDDFVLGAQTVINSGSLVGLFVPPASGGTFSVSDLVIEIYRVFPLDSDATRTPNVPTRVNSPSDVAFDSRSANGGQLNFSSTVLANTFTANNSVLPGGIHASPNQTTGGNGPVTGQEVQLDFSLTTPFSLPADHYFFVPQVNLSNGAQFLWLSASRPISGAGTTPFAPDLQAWTRDENLAPDWLRVGTDIVGGATPPTFNLAFSLDGTTGNTVPEPAYLPLIALGLFGVVMGARRKK
jgi:hypothetical protein